MRSRGLARLHACGRRGDGMCPTMMLTSWWANRIAILFVSLKSTVTNKSVAVRTPARNGNERIGMVARKILVGRRWSVGAQHVPDDISMMCWAHVSYHLIAQGTSVLE